jgi:hypothetical protein
VGQSVTPTWSGSFSLGNTDGDALSFSAQGGVQNGALTGNQSSFALQVDGELYNRGHITSESIQGALTGPGTGPNPINGAVGDFSFQLQNVNPASISGAFGADLN